jgi:hypothetical protein
MKRSLALLGATVAIAGSTLLAGAPASAAGYCNGQIDYACTDRGDGYTFCTVWLGGCYVGL